MFQVKSVEKRGGGKTVVAHLLSGKRVTGDALLYAMGRLGNTDSLNLQVLLNDDVVLYTDIPRVNDARCDSRCLLQRHQAL